MAAPLPIPSPDAVEVAEATLTAVKGLTVLAAIPVVGLALWCDYFERHVEAMKAAREERDHDEEFRMIRLAFLVGAGYQLLLWGTTGDIREHYPTYANLLLVVALILQLRLQLGMETKIRPLTAKTQLRGTAPLLNSGSRAFLFSMLGGAAYLGVLLISLRTVVFIAIATHASPGAAALLLVVGSLGGVLSGLALAFALGPAQVKSMFATKRLPDSSEEAGRIHALFNRARIATPELWLIEGEENTDSGMTNAMIAGFARGSWIFKQGLFLSETLLKKLEWREVEAVILHEISHVKLRHLRKRYLYSAGMILCGCTFAVVLIGVVSILFQGGPVPVYFGMLTVFGGFIYALRRLGEQSRLHEIEADLEAVRLGADIDSLCSALERLDRLNGTPSDRVGPAHPATLERIHVLRSKFAATLATEEAKIKEIDRAA